MTQLKVGDRVRCKPSGKVGVIADIVKGNVGVRFPGEKVGELYLPRELEQFGDEMDVESISSDAGGGV